jgi:hypothetical protein
MICTKKGSHYGRVKPAIDGSILCYGHYIASLWRTLPIRRIVLDRDQGCRACGSTEHLELHHVRYPDIWGAEMPTDLTTFCHECHSYFTEIERRRKYENIEIAPAEIKSAVVSRNSLPVDNYTPDSTALQVSPLTAPRRAVGRTAPAMDTARLQIRVQISRRGTEKD